MDMNKVFQEFVTVALREALGLSEQVFCSDKKMPSRIALDTAGELKLEPDFSWWEGGECVFVGDAKYKNITDRSVPNSDLYQLLAYATALDLPGGMLIYAKGEADEVVHKVRYSGKSLEVAALDLSGTLEDVLARVEKLSDRVREMRDEARRIEQHAA